MIHRVWLPALSMAAFLFACCPMHGGGHPAGTTVPSSNNVELLEIIAANENHAIAMLRQIVKAEMLWRDLDLDGNAQKDFWTADVYGLWACADGAGNPVKAIDLPTAKADQDPAHAVAGTEAPRPYYSPVAVIQPFPSANSGYCVEALVCDEVGSLYAQDGPDYDAKACENLNRFGFAAVPKVYGATGRRVFIVNEEGVVYARDTGMQDSPNTLNWPAIDPTYAAPAWQVVD